MTFLSYKSKNTKYEIGLKTRCISISLKSKGKYLRQTVFGGMQFMS